MGAKQKKIVVVDDEELLVDLVASRLQSDGFEVTSFYSPIAALRDIQENGASLVVTDYNMPEMNGLELLKEIEKQMVFTGIIMTGNPWALAGKDHKYEVIEKVPDYVHKVRSSVRKAVENM